MPYKLYGIMYRPLICTQASPHTDARFLSPGWRSTNLTLKARTDAEADKKALNIWARNQYGGAAIRTVNLENK